MIYSKIKNKKGSIEDVTEILVYIVASALFMGGIYSIFVLALPQITEKFGTGTASNIITEMVNYFPSIMDDAVFWITIILIVLAVVFASNLPTNNSFLVFFILGVILLTIVSYLGATFWGEILTNPQIGANLAQLVKVNLLMTNLHIITGLTGAIMLFVLFKNRGATYT